MTKKTEVKASYTPGPWRYRFKGLEGWIEQDHGVGPGTGMIARIYPCDPSTVQEANARLIAAAPELLEALKLLLADMKAHYRDENGDSDHDGINYAESVVAKAEGRNKGE